MTIQETALQFCKLCLGWKDATIPHEDFISRGVGRSTPLIIHDRNRISQCVADFLGERYWIQINRDASTGWNYVARVGMQNLTSEPRVVGRQQAEFSSASLTHAILGACVAMKELEAA